MYTGGEHLKCQGHGGALRERDDDGMGHWDQKTEVLAARG